jgi:hypothetical protein
MMGKLRRDRYIVDQIRAAGSQTAQRRRETGSKMSHALALLCWRDFQFLHGGFTGRDLAWLLVGAFLAAGVAWAISRRRRRWI